MTFPTYPTLTVQLPARQLASFPSTGPLGWITTLWLWWLKRHLNRARYKLTLKGRAAKRPELRGYGGSIKLKNARRWGLYIDDKMESKLNRYSQEIGAHPERQKVERLLHEADELRVLYRESNEARINEGDKLNKARDELAAAKLTIDRNERAAKLNAAALDAIYRLMDGTEWDSDTTSSIGEILHGLGFKIRDCNDPEPDHLADGKEGHPEPLRFGDRTGPMKGGQ